MQNVVHNSKCDGVRDSELNEVGKEHSGSSSPLSGNLSVERGQSLTSLQSNFMADLSESDDDDVSEVESFILDQGDLEDDSMVEGTKFLLTDDVGDSGIDAETQCRLEALLQSSAKLTLSETKTLADPEVLKRLTSSVSCALDEAAAALNRMRTEPHTSADHGDGRSLVEACTDGDICTVRRMLDEGRNVNEVTDEGESLLALACASGYYELAQLLLAMRANVEDRGLKDTTPLMEAASAGHADIVKLLIQHGADVNAQTSQDKKMKGAKLKNQDLNMKAQQDTHSNLPSIVCPEGNTPLMFACAGGHEDVVSILLEAGANVEDHNENGHTPLMEAASAGHVGVAKLLVAHGASINTHSNEFKESALTLACYKGHLEMVRFLLEAGADQEHKTDEMHTALMEASMDGHVEVARLLLDSGAQVNMPADSFESPLTLAACGGHVELAMLLLDRGANIEEVNDEGYTPLMEAAREGHEEMVALLLSQGADINAQTEETQETALTLACCGGFLEVADFLIKAGADIEIGASTPLMEASQEGHLELVRYLINAGANVNAQTATGDSALTYACENGHTDVSDLLLQAGAELEHESEGGRTPLMKAARAGHLCTVQFLISKRANVNKQTTNNDHNPLSLACAGGHLPVVELLLAHGADPTHKLKDNSTMLIEASKGGHTAVVQLLLDYPNSLLSSPTATQEVSQIQSPTVEATEAPRVPPHGLQPFPPQDSEQTSSASSSYVANVQSVPRIQELLQVRDTPLPGSSLQTTPKQKSLLRKNVLVKNNEAPSFSMCENIQRCHFRSKTNASAQANSMSIQAETSSQKVLANDMSSNGCMGGGGGGGGGIESVEDKDSKPSERLEACINSMMKKAELLHPNPEEQILQKQQILEELQRVERELQEKAQAQLLLTAQHQQHRQHLQGLGSVSAGSPTIATVTSNSVAFPNVSGVHGQQLLLNSGTILDVGSLSSTVVPDLSGHLGINLRSTSATAHLSAPPSVQTIPAQLYQHQKPVQQPVVTTSIASDHSKPRLSKQATKQAKTSVPKQQFLQQSPLQNAPKVQSQSHLEEVEKMNLRNVVLTEQQQQQHQQLLHQHPQQQFVLSEFTQNLTLRANSHFSDGAADALALMQAAGGIKFTTDAAQTHGIPIFDPVSVGQALLQQQLQHQQQLQLQHQQQFTQVIQQETKRQQQQQQHQQQLHYDKSAKSVKGKNSKAQQQLLQTTQPQLQALQAQQSQQVVKQQLSSSCTDACTLVGNIPLDAAGVLTLGGMTSSAFPVSLAVSPALPSVSIASSCGTTYAHNISLEDSLMVASPPRTLHETLGDIMTGPTTQLAGNQIAVGQQGATSHCIEPNCLAVATSGVGVGLTLPSLPGGNSPSTTLPLAYHTLAPAATSCVPTQVTTAADGTVTPHHIHISHGSTGASTPAPPPLYPPIDLNSQTDSNHDTALTLACAGGHEELVSLLLSRGANIEHRDKKGFTPLMLAATAGHAGVVEILLNHAADIEAQSERTKDTALSLACSGGRIEVVDILLQRGANKEHRNVSDYTPLSLAASGGYTNIIKLLLSHGAEINSRTGSKLGISPLMLAAMNGHTQAVKLLLDMGSDINAQIETNRNTALTLACFQGRHEVVSLLLDRKANVEHRAKTGLTPLMEAASGGYVEVGRVLLDKGADVNAPPVPSSRDTALTIAADKGHYRFVELLIQRDAIIDAKNKKGNSPLWLSCNGGHLDVVQLLAQSSADIDSQDNRKVSCLMAAFRKGHVKVVKWMVKHVSQFPSDQEMSRYISTLTDKDLLKKCHQCVEAIRVAKERQAAEANKYATILLEELDQERSRAENRRLAAARRRERKRKKKKEKQELLRAAKAAAEETKKSEKNCDLRLLKQQQNQNSQQDSQSEAEDEEDDDDEEDEEEEDKDYLHEKCLVNDIGGIPNSRLLPENPCANKYKMHISSETPAAEFPNVNKDKEMNLKEYDVNHILDFKKHELSRSEKKRESDREKSKTHEKNKRNMLCKSSTPEIRTQKDISTSEKLSNKLVESNSNNTFINSSRNSKKCIQRQDTGVISSSPSSTSSASSTISKVPSTLPPSQNCSDTKGHNSSRKHHKHTKDILVNGMSMVEYDEFCALFSAATTRGRTSKCPSDSKLSLDSLGELALDLPAEVALSAGLRSPSAPTLAHCMKSPLANSTSPKKWQKRDEGWKEVVRRSKKVSVPANAISRVIGRGGCNINAIREASGAHIEVEKQKGQGERTVIIRGSAESTRLAQQLITALIKEPEKELSEILIRCGLNRTIACNSSSSDILRTTGSNNSNNTIVTTSQVLNINQNKSNPRQSSATKSSGIVTSSITKASTIPPPSLPANAAPPFTNRARPGVANTQNIRPGIPVCTVGTPPFLSTTQNAWTGVVVSGKVPSPVTPRPSVPVSNTSTTFSLTAVSTRVVATTSVDKSPIVRQLFPIEKKSSSGLQSTTTSTKTTVSYTMAVIAPGKTPKTVPANIVTVTTRVTATSDTKVSTIAPAQIERAGSAPPVPMPSMISSQVSVGQNATCGPSVQPFTVSQSSRTASSQNSVQQQGPPVSRVHGSQTQNKLFISTATSSNQVTTSASTSVSPTSCSTTTTAQSAIAQEYSPFNNLFSKVAQPSVWGQKDKETKPNFASVAASGITSVSSQVQNSNPVQSTLMLSLPQTSEHELIVDAAKAPGYRGNLHISPSASSNSSASSSSSQHAVPHSSNFGPIGSGPRSAPCTPPLGPIGPPSAGTNARHSTPPAVPSPPPTLHSRSLPDSHSGALNDLPRSMTSGMGPPHLTSQMSEVIFHHQGLNMSSHPSRLSSYPLTSTVAGPAGTNTTFSQHSPLSSVGTITPEGTSSGNIPPVVQSNLNPNAPDFSSRASLLMAPHCPPMHHVGPPRLQPGPNTFQENAIPSPIAPFRPLLTTTGGLNHSFPLHPIPNPHSQAMNRFPFHHAPNHQQQQTGDYSQNAPPAHPVGTLPPGMGALSQGTDGVPMLNMIGGFPAQAMSQVLPGSGTIPPPPPPHHYPGMQSMMGIRPGQRSASTTPSVGASSKDEGSPMATMSPNASPQGSNLPSPTGMNVQENPNPAGTIGEDRKLPRPIGMERAQRKNPMYGGVSDIGNIWSFGSSNRSDMPTSADWIANMPTGISTVPPMPQEEQLPSMMHNNYGATRFTEMITSEGNQPIEHPYQAVAGGYPFMNGVPPHMLTPHIYQAAAAAAVAASNAPAQIENAVEMWGVHPKIPLSSGGDGVPQAVDQKMPWHSWSPHQA